MIFGIANSSRGLYSKGLSSNTWEVGSARHKLPFSKYFFDKRLPSFGGFESEKSLAHMWMFLCVNFVHVWDWKSFFFRCLLLHAPNINLDMLPRIKKAFFGRSLQRCFSIHLCVLIFRKCKLKTFLLDFKENLRSQEKTYVTRKKCNFRCAKLRKFAPKNILLKWNIS